MARKVACLAALLSLTAALFLQPLSSRAQEKPPVDINAFAPTPPMGWNSWNHFACRPLEVWARPLTGGNRAVILLNRDTQPHPITVHWTDLNYPDSLNANLRDLWKHADLGRFRGSYTATVASHAVVMLTLKP